MINDSHERVIAERTHSRPIPWVWAATFMLSPAWWLNQEDGQLERPGPLPVWADVEALLLEVMEP